jgi:hypothetical protein
MLKKCSSNVKSRATALLSASATASNLVGPFDRSSFQIGEKWCQTINIIASSEKSRVYLFSPLPSHLKISMAQAMFPFLHILLALYVVLSTGAQKVILDDSDPKLAFGGCNIGTALSGW